MAAAAVAVPEALDLLGGGRLTKRVLREGDGALPEPGGQVEVHYVCRLKGSKEVLDSSYERGRPLAFALGEGEVIPAWEHAVPTMRCGELAELGVHPELAFGAAGCASGAVPAAVGDDGGDADASDSATRGSMQFELELVSVGPPRGSGDDSEELSQEERLARSSRLKESGNSAFKEADCAAAAQDYQEALRLLGFAGSEEDAAAWPDSARQEARSKLALACLLNSAQCELKLERFHEAAEHASRALELDPASSKAVYRRGLAKLGIGLADQARVDLLEAARREPRNAEIRAKLQECQSKIQATEQSARSTFGGMFGRGSIYGEKEDAQQDRAGDAVGSGAG